MIVPVPTRPHPHRPPAPLPAPAPDADPSPASPAGPELHLHLDHLEIHGLGPLTPSLVAAGLRDGLARLPRARLADLSNLSNLSDLAPAGAPPEPRASLSTHLPLAAAPSSYAVGLGLASAVFRALTEPPPR